MVYLLSLLGRLLLFPYLWYRGRSLFGRRVSNCLGYLFIAETALYGICVLTHRYIQTDWMSIVMSVGIFVFFSLGYGMMFLVSLDVLRFLDQKGRGYYTRLSEGLRRLIGYLALLIFLGIAGASAVIGYRNVRYPRVVYQQLTIGRLTKPGTKPQKRMRLLQVSDIHIGEGITEGFVRRAVDLMMEQRADMILVCGDYIDHDGKYAYAPEVMKQMQRLQAPMGVYYVLGNHEYRADSTAKQEWVAKVGAKLLRDEVAYPADSTICLIGRDDYVNPYHRQIEDFVPEIEPTGRPVVLMAHTPEGLDSLQTQKPIDLALYGHTHGGQIWPMHWVVWLKYGIVYGRRQDGKTTLFVSSGIGSAGSTYRIGSRSEIVVWDLYW